MIPGHVTDQLSAVMEKRFAIKNLATSVSRTTRTNGAGDYVFLNIPPGNYDINLEAAGFSKRPRANDRPDPSRNLRRLG
ncbi:MAG: carboxypeptidase regulatory-like domain-containing protein [Acidobacteria bacterium]|nr:carboxypeptidase regulatory-like domain-containing protein [Acidobacteriota bacterium]